jgi:MFS family permease
MAKPPEPPPVAAAARRRGGLWHHRDFRRLWIGETVSQFGSNVSLLALPLTAILVVHASTFDIGLLSALESVAFLIIGLPAGAWVDRMRFRWVLVVTDLIRVAAMGSIPIAAATGVLTIWQLFAVALVMSVATVFFDVAYQSYLPQLVDRSALVEGNSKLQASESVSQIAGPSAGGLLIQALTAPYAIAVDSASFLWSAIWVTRIVARPAKSARVADRHLGREVLEGLRFVVRNPLLRAIAICTGSANLFSGMVAAVIYVLLARELHLSAGLIGLLSSLSAIGGLLGALSANRIAQWLGQGPTIWIASAVMAPFGFVAPFLHRDWTLGLYAVAQLGLWAGIVIYNIAQVSFRQGLTPPALLGRMNATMRFFVWGTMPLGGLLGGTLGSLIGVRDTLLVAAIGGCLPVLPVFFSPLRHQRELPHYVDPDPDPAKSTASGGSGA